MQLRIGNVAKIKEATINVDGITVIAGENNTGKSTIGKVIFSIFNSMSNMETKIENERKNRLEHIAVLLIQNWAMQNGLNSIEFRKNYRIWAKKFTNGMMEVIAEGKTSDIESSIRQIVQDTKFWDENADVEDLIKECLAKVEAIVQVSDEKVMMEVVTRWFSRVFEQQISPLNEENSKSYINLKIKDKLIDFCFEKNNCIDLKTEFNILHEAFYIDNPFIIDYMANDFLRGELKPTDNHLLQYLCNENGIFDFIFEAVVAKDKLVEIDNILAEIMGGEFVEQPDGEFYLTSEQYTKPINIKNLSTGLKSFAIIKRLLENGSLKEKDVLILDEPEIHLHPEWQLAYAEIVVLLQKKFDLTMIINTHSPYFLDAIDVFAAKYKISDKLNFYMTEMQDGVSYLKDVTENIDIIYKKLSDPLQKLENIRSGLV